MSREQLLLIFGKQNSKHRNIDKVILIMHINRSVFMLKRFT